MLYLLPQTKVDTYLSHTRVAELAEMTAVGLSLPGSTFREAGKYGCVAPLSLRIECMLPNETLPNMLMQPAPPCSNCI